MNAVFRYIYRDASNYKSAGHVVLTGEVTPDQWARMVAAIGEGDLGFIAHQVGVPEVFPWLYEEITADDHVWHETCRECRGESRVVRKMGCKACRKVGFVLRSNAPHLHHLFAREEVSLAGKAVELLQRGARDREPTEFATVMELFQTADKTGRAVIEAAWNALPDGARDDAGVWAEELDARERAFLWKVMREFGVGFFNDGDGALDEDTPRVVLGLADFLS